MSLGVITKRKPAAEPEPDLLTLRELADLPSFSRAEMERRAAVAALADHETTLEMLQARATADDPVTRAQARAGLRHAAEADDLIRARAQAATQALATVRAEVTRAVLEAHRPAFTDRLKRLGAKWLEAEREAASAFEEAHRLAQLVGFGPEGAGPFFDAVPRQLTPGLTAEWRQLVKVVGGWDV